MKKNKGLFGGVLEFGGNVIGKVMDTALSITDKISRKLFGDRTPLRERVSRGELSTTPD